MSITTLRKPSNGRRIVPHWFKEILHAIIYADCVQAYIAIQTIALFLGAETHNRRILALYARGLNHSQIAARLKVSRYSIIRAMNRFSKMSGRDTLIRMQASSFTADILDTFIDKNYTHNENIHTVIAFLWGLTCSELGVLSALLRELSESESIRHVCISKSRYHEIKKSLLGMIDLGQKTYTRKTGKKSAWSLRETDQFGIICDVNENVYFSVHFLIFIFTELRGFSLFSAIIFSPKCPIWAKSVQNHVSGRGFRYE
jgi:predicted transcriptional regulator